MYLSILFFTLKLCFSFEKGKCLLCLDFIDRCIPCSAMIQTVNGTIFCIFLFGAFCRVCSLSGMEKNLLLAYGL